MEKRHSSSAAYNINYHFVWCPKYRKKILIGDVAAFLDWMIRDISAKNSWNVLELKVMADHMHLVSCRPTYTPVKIVKTLKGISGLQIFKRFPEKLWKGVLWSPSYYVGTAGRVSSLAIERYIREQQAIHPPVKTGGSSRLNLIKS